MVITDELLPLIEPLTDRERDILRLLAERLSDQEIAQQLVIGLGTVKWYNKQIYGKLGVKGRRQAGARARELGLLDETSVPSHSHNLPAQTTPFMGRGPELTDLRISLDNPTVRLVTIHGLAGIGKTRLAIECARALLDIFPDGVYFIPLAPLHTPDHIASAILEHLNVPVSPSTSTRDQLLRYLRGKHLLLVLDNFEHVLDGAEIVTDLLRHAPGVKVLTTSRERLNLYGEMVYTIGGLSLPDEEADDLLQSDAVALFVRRAAWVSPGFRADEPALRTILRICRLTEGMPLAIELAAAWVGVLPLEAIADEIERGIDILETELRDMPARQRSVRAAFDHSWKLLNRREQIAFARFAVFRGGCTREGAQAVTGVSLRSLGSLVDKSLLRYNPETERYEIHELLRQFAEEQLKSLGITETQAVHAVYYTNFVERCGEGIKCQEQAVSLDAIEAEFDNVRTGWRFCLTQCAWKELHQKLDGLAWYGNMRGRYPDVDVLFQTALAELEGQTGELADRLRARIEIRRCSFAPHHDRSDIILAKAHACLETAARLNDQPEMAFALMTLAMLERVHTEDFATALHHAQMAVDLYQAIGDPFYMAGALNCQAQVYYFFGHHQTALDLAQKCVQMRRDLSDRVGLARTLLGMGAITYGIGEYEQGQRYYEEALEIANAIGARTTAAHIRVNLSYVPFLKGDLGAARPMIGEALAMARKAFDSEIIAYALATLSMIASIEEDYGEAYRLIEEARSLASGLPGMQAVAIAQAMAACGGGDYETARTANLTILRVTHRMRTIARMMWALPTTCIILAHDGQTERAAALLGLLDTHPASTRRWMDQWPLVARTRADLQARLGAEAYAAAWQRGTSLDVQQVATNIIEQLSSFVSR